MSNLSHGIKHWRKSFHDPLCPGSRCSLSSSRVLSLRPSPRAGAPLDIRLTRENMPLQTGAPRASNRGRGRGSATE